MPPSDTVYTAAEYTDYGDSSAAQALVDQPEMGYLTRNDPSIAGVLNQAGYMSDHYPEVLALFTIGFIVATACVLLYKRMSSGARSDEYSVEAAATEQQK